MTFKKTKNITCAAIFALTLLLSIFFMASLMPPVLAEDSMEMETWINIRGEEVNVFSASVEKLLVRGYFEQKILGEMTYSSKFDILDALFNEESHSIRLHVPDLDNGSLLLITIPRGFLDSTYGYNDEKREYNLEPFLC